MPCVTAKPFVHLHVHTCYSLLDGACRIGDLMDAALHHNMPALAITDHGVMYGVVDFYKTARQKGVKPVLGCETYVARGSRHDRGAGGTGSGHHHLVLLAKDSTGYHNLVRLVSLAQLEGFYYKPRIDKELLARHAEGLIGMSACLQGEVAARLAEDNVDAAVRAAGEYREILGDDNFFLEMQDHGLDEQKRVNAHIREVSHRSACPLVATNDVHYLQRDHAPAHEVLLCLQTQTVLSDPNRMRYRTDEFYLKSRAEMEALFAEFPEALDRTVEIAERCNAEIEFNRLHFPTFTVPGNVTQKAYLIERGREGLRKRYNVRDPERPQDAREQEIVDRFRAEMDVIDRTGFVNYFLVVWDFVRFAREQGIPVGPGRGSGGGSLVAYALGITSIDPLRYGLIFERFLNPERVSPPDFDIDFCQARREEVIAYVKRKYGRENCAQIITYGSLGAKTVIRDVGRVLEIPYSECDRLSKMVPEDPKISLRKALDTNPELQRAYESVAHCRRILDYGFVLEGLYRNPGTHAAGVVIGEKPLIEIVPLARDKNNETITQYSMEPLGDIGLLKMDFLGLKTLTVIHETLSLVREAHGTEIDIEALPFDDGKTFELLNRGDTVGVFQLESSGMRDLIRRIGIDCIEDLIAVVALYRPGPMNMLPDYVERKGGKAAVEYPHPLLEPILKETYGVMVYQEQVQKAANVLAGYSLGEADILRRAMGKKKKDTMDKQFHRFVEGCAKVNRIGHAAAARVFELMAKFAEYGFNKAHSAGYAIIAYQTAFLKANYPTEFLSALISSEIGNFDKLPTFIGETSAMGLKVLPPDVNASGVRFRPEGEDIRYGLAGIKNVGSGAAESIVRERKQNGAYSSLIELCSRVDLQLVNRKVLESLVRCGATDSLNPNRGRLFNGIEYALARAGGLQQDRRAGQGSLFDLLDDQQTAGVTDDELPDATAWTESESLAAERELLGVYTSGHPLSQFAALLKRYRLTPIQDLAEMEDHSLTRVGGIVTQLQKRVARASKEVWATCRVEDLDGTVEVLVFSETYRKYEGVLRPDAPLLFCGEVSRRDETPKLVASEIYDLRDGPKLFATRLGIQLPANRIDDQRLERLKGILRRHPGNTPVMICLLFPSGEKVLIDTDASLHVLAEESLIGEIEHELGEHTAHVVVQSQPCLNGRSRRPGPPRNRAKTP